MRKALMIGFTLLTLAACNRKTTLTFTAPPPSVPYFSSSQPSHSSFSFEFFSSSTSSISSLSSFPSAVKIAVPFSPQAPFAHWGDPYQEGCEEMALIMVQHYWNALPLSLEDADAELLELTQWEKTNGFSEDVTTKELQNIAEKKYGLSSIVESDVTEASIKHTLAKGLPVIVPAAGRLLGNPYFSGEGPWYHMLVITGFDRHGFITNDPGTRRGKSYRYDAVTLLNAIHDWTGVKEDIAQGKKAMLIITGKDEN